MDYSKSVFQVHVVMRKADYAQPWNSGQRNGSAGTCFAVKHAGDTYLATCYHVVEDAEFVDVERDGKLYECQVLKTAPEYDLALIAPVDKSFYASCKPLSIAVDPARGDVVTLVGFPENGVNMSVTHGSIARIETAQLPWGFQTLLLQVDITSGSGNSGGPLLRNGVAVGVHRGLIGSMRTSIHGALLDRIITRTVDMPCDFPCSYSWTQNEAVRKYYGVSEGIVIKKVHAEPGGKSHIPIQVEDVLLSVNGKTVTQDGRVNAYGDQIGIRGYICTLDPTTSVPVVIQRKGKRETLSMRFPLSRSLVPRHSKSANADFTTVMGHAYTTLSSMYIKATSRSDNQGRVDIDSCYYLCKNNNQDFTKPLTSKTPGLEQLVVYADMIPDVKNRGCGSANGYIVESVNGVAVYNLEHFHNLCRDAAGKEKFINIKYDTESTTLIDISDIKSPTDYDKYNINLCSRMLGIQNYNRLTPWK